jgi:hypothetical protein
VVWTAPAGLAGCLFLGLAGVKHAVNSPRNAKEHLAMATDLFVAGVVGIYLASLVVRQFWFGSGLSLTISGFLGAFVDEL